MSFHASKKSYTANHKRRAISRLSKGAYKATELNWTLSSAARTVESRWTEL